MHEIKKGRDLWRLHTARKIAYVDCPTGVTSPKMGVLSVNELIEADAQQHKLSHGVLTFSAIIVAYRRTYIHQHRLVSCMEVEAVAAPGASWALMTT